MSNINLKRFVDVNIQPHVKSTLSGSRDTVVLFTPEGEANEIKTFSNLTEVTYEPTSLTYKYLKMYFDNNGVNVEVHEAIGYNDLTKEIIKALPNDKIYIACAADTSDRENCYNKLKAIIIDLNDEEEGALDDINVYGINEKILLACTHSIEIDNTLIKNFAVKYSSVIGAEMTMAAYLSQIDFEGIDTVQDYCFTQENINAENINDEKYGELQTANINVDIDLSGTVRNCGGNCKDGSDLVNNFARIVLHQSLTQELIELLSQKIKSTTGISKIYTVITQVLEQYKTCGYLTTDKIWQDRTLSVVYQNKKYNIINKGDALVNGYVVKVLPYTTLTDSQKSAKSAPPIYVIIADQYSIRKITITGEVI